jgi:nucleoside-diphosphate-sugar epimerase
MQSFLFSRASILVALAACLQRSAAFASQSLLAHGKSPPLSREPTHISMRSGRTLGTASVALVSKNGGLADCDVAVIGASGRTGAECVRYCVATGRSVRALSRKRDLESWPSPIVSSVSMDVTIEASIGASIAGAGVVVFAATASAGGDPMRIDNKGLQAVARACIAAQVPRLVVISGAGVTKNLSPAYRFLNMFGKRMDQKAAGEEAVRRLYASAPSRLSYTIVRPSGLLDAAPLGVPALELNQGDEVAGFISRADVAAVCIECAVNPAAARTTFECYNAGTAVPTATLSVSEILSSPTAAKVVRFVTREQERVVTPAGTRTGRESRARDWHTIFSKLQQDVL